MANPTLGDFLSEADLAALAEPTGTALGLPGLAYDRDFYALEQRGLFPRTWCAVAFASDIPEPGDALPVELAGWPLLLVRGRDRAIRAFHNVCRHRSNRVVEERCTGLQRLVCPWHSWTYDLDGHQIATPRIGGQRTNADPAFDTSDVDLKSVPVAVWLDFVMVNLDGTAAPFDRHIAPLDALFSGYDFSELRVSDAWALDFPGNWKLTVEGAIEDYHLPYIHGQLVRGELEARPRLDYADGCFFANSSVREYRDNRAAGEAVALTSGLPSILRDEGDVEPRTFVVSVFPTGFITSRTNYMWLWLILPEAADRTRVDMRHYYKGDAATDPALAEVRRKLLDEWRLVLEQDVPLIGNVQANMERPGEAGIRTRFSPYWESNVQRFQQSVVDVLRDA